MKEVSITDGSGVSWLVRRKWVPWDLRWRGPRMERRKQRKSRSDWSWADLLDFPDALLFFDDGCLPVLVFIGAILALALVVFFVLPIAIFVLELLLLVFLVAVGAGLKIVLRRPWFVEAISETEIGRMHLVWKVVGWGRSGEVVDEIASQLRSGIPVPSARDAILVRGA